MRRGGSRGPPGGAAPQPPRPRSGPPGAPVTPGVAAPVRGPGRNPPGCRWPTGYASRPCWLIRGGVWTWGVVVFIVRVVAGFVVVPAAGSGRDVDAAGSVAGGAGRDCQGGQAGGPEGDAGDAGPG